MAIAKPSSTNHRSGTSDAPCILARPMRRFWSTLPKRSRTERLASQSHISVSLGGSVVSAQRSHLVEGRPSLQHCPQQWMVDTMLKDSEAPRYAARRTKRTYSAQTKAELMAACLVPGASIAAIANAHDMNANVLHRWLKGQRQGLRVFLRLIEMTAIPAAGRWLSVIWSSITPADAHPIPRLGWM